MKKKTLGMLVFTLVMTAAVISTAGLMIKKDLEDSNEMNCETVSSDIEEKTAIKLEDEPDDPQLLITRTGYLSIPAAAFTPLNYNLDFWNFGRYLQTTEQFMIYCYAPVYLPTDANVIRVALFWCDQNIAYDIEIKLLNYGGLSGETTMADFTSSGSSGKGSSEDRTIEDPVIDNGLKCYYLEVGFSTMMVLEYIVIEYEYQVIINSIEAGVSNTPPTNDNYRN